jgi:mono/diheme cytochrome c family protein
MPKIFVYIAIIAVVASWIPLALVARARAAKSSVPRVHFFQDMDTQPKIKAQASNAIFADRRGMRPRNEGTIAYGSLREDDHFYRGRVIVDGEEQWATTYPDRIEITEAFVRRGQERFNIFCATCHGMAGEGQGPISQRADRLDAGKWGWVPPTSLHDQSVRDREPGHLFNTITNGIRNMAAYGPQITPEDRWAIVSYIRALQFSRTAPLEVVPAERRDALR